MSYRVETAGRGDLSNTPITEAAASEAVCYARAMIAMCKTGIIVRARVSKECAGSVYELLEERSRWLREQGIAQWETCYPRQRFDREVEAGVVWCWCNGVEIDATVTLLPDRA